MRAAVELAGEPKTATRPASGITRPTMLRIRVLLPAPLGPSSPRHSPPRTARLTPFTAVVWPKRFTSDSTWSGGGGVVRFGLVVRSACIVNPQMEVAQREAIRGLHRQVPGLRSARRAKSELHRELYNLEFSVSRTLCALSKKISDGLAVSSRRSAG